MKLNGVKVRSVFAKNRIPNRKYFLISRLRPQVTIIDYTLSRITINNHTLFNNLAKDPDLFVAEGDFQFEVYRMMRKAVG